MHIIGNTKNNIKLQFLVKCQNIDVFLMDVVKYMKIALQRSVGETNCTTLRK